MGNALIVMVVPEEMLGYSRLHVRNEAGEPVPIESPGRWFVRGGERRKTLREHPDAFWMLPVPYSALWRPVDEPEGARWHEDARLRQAQTAKNCGSLEAFLNRALGQLDRMARSGWWILKRARVKVAEMRGVPPHRVSLSALSAARPALDEAQPRRGKSRT